jgi:hypothetical protein
MVVSRSRLPICATSVPGQQVGSTSLDNSPISAGIGPVRRPLHECRAVRRVCSQATRHIVQRRGQLRERRQFSRSRWESSRPSGRCPRAIAAGPSKQIPPRRGMGGDPQRAFRLDSSGRPIPAGNGSVKRLSSAPRTSSSLGKRAQLTWKSAAQAQTILAQPQHAQGRGVPWVPPGTQELQGSTGRPISNGEATPTVGSSDKAPQTPQLENGDRQPGETTFGRRASSASGRRAWSRDRAPRENCR